MLVRILKGGIHGHQVLSTAHRCDPSLSRSVDRLILKIETGGEPSLFNLGVNRFGAIELKIDLLKDGFCKIIHVCLKSIVEYNFEVGVV